MPWCVVISDWWNRGCGRPPKRSAGLHLVGHRCPGSEQLTEVQGAAVPVVVLANIGAAAIAKPRRARGVLKEGQAGAGHVRARIRLLPRGLGADESTGDW